MALLELDRVSVRYGHVEALREVSLRVEPGEAVTLLGANGAGKSTTLRAISGLTPLAGGQVRLDGQRIDRLPAHQLASKGIGHVPEGRRVFARMSVLDNLELGAYSRPRSALAETARVLELFPALAQRRQQLAGTLSGGEQQMLAIGRALMGAPRLLLLDEPSMGLAPVLVQRLLEILREVTSQGTALLLVEQNAAHALSLATRGYVLDTGSVAVEGTSAELRGDPQVRAAYLGEGAA